MLLTMPHAVHCFVSYISGTGIHEKVKERISSLED